MDKVFVGVKDNLVVNTLIIDDENINLIANIKDEFGYEFLVQCDDNQVSIGWDFDGVGVVPPKPYDSWVFNQEIRQWETPIAYPIDGKPYQWNESTISWLEIVQDIPNDIK
jgi:hypothetical protein